MSVLDSLNTSIESAIESGSISEKEHGAIIEAARKVATVMDEPEWPLVRGKIDNVSPSVFLKYCDALGILPSEKTKEEPEKPKVTIVGNSKWAKGRVVNG